MPLETIPTLTINPTTGEVLSQGQMKHETIKPKRKRPYRLYWMGNMSFPIEMIISIKAARDFHILFSLIKHTEFQNKIFASNEQIGRTVGMDKRNVSASLKRLGAAGFIVRPEGAKRGWVMNPAFFWRGYDEDFPHKDYAGAEFVGKAQKPNHTKSPEEQNNTKHTKDNEG